jgi:Xaa-Pro aminopeptidase
MSSSVIDFSAHRASVLTRLANDEAMLLFGGPHHHRNADCEYKYRPHSDIFWLSGWRQPEIALFLRPGEKPFVIFCQEKDEKMEMWTGYRPGTQGAISDFDANDAHPYDTLSEKLPALLQGVSTLHYNFGMDPDLDGVLMASIAKSQRLSRESFAATPETFRSPSWLLHELRLIKNSAEIATMRKAAAITAKAHIAAMGAAEPGGNERQLDVLIDYTMRNNGAIGSGYTNIVAAGTNATTLHYIDNDQPIDDGDLILIDAGAEVGYYTADVTRTFPANGKFSPLQRDAYNWVLKAMEASIAACTVGTPYTEIHAASVTVLTEAMIALGLLTGSIEDRIADKAYKKYFPHGTSHWLGLDVHDVGTYVRDNASRLLMAGMVLTVEPGLYIPIDDETAPEELRGLGIRIEDDILITENGPDNLTIAIPKSVAAVEAACQS